MKFPSWFQSAIQQRLDCVSGQIERHPELQQLRAEEQSSFDSMCSGLDNIRSAAFMEWEDKHHFKSAAEKERLYLQGMRDGVQLLFALLSDSATGEAMFAEAETKQHSVKPDGNTEE